MDDSTAALRIPPKRGPLESLLLPLTCAVVSLGICLRVDGLDRKSLWHDEVYTVLRVSQPTTSDMVAGLKKSPLAPLYYLVLRAWVKLWGLSDVSIRSLSLVFGLLALPLTYLAWRPLIGHRAALWALSLLGLNAYHIWYSNDAKMYALVWLLATLSSAAFLRIILGSPGWSAWLAIYAIVNALLPLVSYVGFAPLVVQGVYGVSLLPSRRDCWRKVLTAGLLNLVALLPFSFWLPTARNAVEHRTGIDWIPKTIPAQVPIELYHLFGTFLLGYHTADGPTVTGIWKPMLIWNYNICISTAIIISLLVIIRIVLGYGGASRPPPSYEPVAAIPPDDIIPMEIIAFLAVWLLLPIAEVLVFSLTVYPVWGVPRYLTGVAPGLILWLSVVLSSLRAKWLSLALGTLLLGGNLIIIAFDRTHSTRIPWREVAQAIEHSVKTTACLEAARQRDKLGFRTEMELVLAERGEPTTKVELIYAMRHFDNTIHVPVERALSLHKPFILVDCYSGLPRPCPPGLSSRREQDYLRRRLYSIPVFQDKLTATPDPFEPLAIDIWVFIPAYRAPPVHARIRSEP